MDAPALSQDQSTAPPATGDGADSRYKVLDRVMKRHQFRQDALIEVLTAAQENFGWLSVEVLTHVARRLNLPPSRVYGVATFYQFFSLAPKGRHHCIICVGTACYVGRASEIQAAVEKRFDIRSGHTTADDRLTLTTARCLGSCGLAPVVVIDGELQGRLTPEGTVSALEAVLEGAENDEDGPTQTVPAGGETP